MSSDRFVITNQMWALMQHDFLGKKSDPGRTGRDALFFLEAVLWIARTDCPWRDLPPHFGKWNTVFERFQDWAKADVLKRIFDALFGEPDMEYAMVDGIMVKVHGHGQGANGDTNPD
jgi:transposase